MKKHNPSKFDIPCSVFCGSSGFTLVEVMLVVVIVLIVAGIAVPKMSGSFSATRMSDATRSTVRVARYARSMAILEQSDCTLSFATNRISLTTASETTTNPITESRATVKTLAQRRLPEGVKITEFENLTDESVEDRTVLFYPSGMTDGFELTLTDDKNRRRTIKCNPITGNVTLEEK